MTFSGCDAFLELEPLDKVSPDQLTDTQGGVKALLANIYTKMPMEDFNYRPNNGFNQHQYDGVNATTRLSFYTDEATRSDAGLFGQEGFNYWPYEDIRQVNLFMENVETAKGKGTITEDEANRMTSEAHFIRAYMYYGMAKRLGGEAFCCVLGFNCESEIFYAEEFAQYGKGTQTKSTGRKDESRTTGSGRICFFKEGLRRGVG